MTSLPLEKCEGCGELVEPFARLCSACANDEDRFKLWVMVCRPRTGDEFLVAWRGEAFTDEVGNMGTSNASDYGLDDVPGFGLWVREGRVKISGVRVNCPLDPDEWDTVLDYDGEWRRPTLDELRAQAEEPVLPKREQEGIEHGEQR